MSDWTLWLMAAGTLVILELFTGTFYLLMIAMGLAVGALAALAGGGMTLQIVASAVASVVAIGALQARRKRHARMPVRAKPVVKVSISVAALSGFARKVKPIATNEARIAA